MKNEKAAKPKEKAVVKEKPKPDYIKLVIVDATFTKDFDGGWTDGKQDPRVEWTFLGKKMNTITKDDAGLKAAWGEEFKLDDI